MSKGRLYCTTCLGDVKYLTWATPERVRSWLDALKSSLNLEGSRGDQYGVVFYPK
jgi:hypothetical protein